MTNMVKTMKMRAGLLACFFAGMAFFPALEGICASNVAEMFPRRFVVLSRDVVEERQVRKGTMYLVPYEGPASGPGKSVVLSGATQCTGTADVEECRRRAVVNGLSSLFDTTRSDNPGRVGSFTAVENSRVEAERVHVDRYVLINSGMEILSEEAFGGEYRVVVRVEASPVGPGVFSAYSDGEAARRGAERESITKTLGHWRGEMGRDVQKTISHTGRRFREIVQSLGRACTP